MTETARNKIIGNLRDAECGEAEIQACVAALEQGSSRQALWVLERHRQVLLDRYHHCRKCIDCLDYLMTQLEQRREGPHEMDGTQDL